MAGKPKKSAVQPFEDKELEDYERELGSEFLPLFVNLMEKTDSQKKCKAESMQTFLSLHNHKITQEFLNSIIFFDSKRPITKDILMRIDLLKIADKIQFQQITEFYNAKLKQLDVVIAERDWKEYKKTQTLLRY